MKLRGLVPFFTITNLGAIYIFPQFGLIWNLYFPLLGESTLGSTAEGQGTAAKQRLVAVLLSDINDQHTNFQFGILQIINENNETL
jgi:hypothetical protein